MKKKGFAIILVLATLVLLALLAYIYIKTALIDRNIARNYMDNKRAQLIAQSGVEYAIGGLEGYLKDGAFFDMTRLAELRYIDAQNPSLRFGSISNVDGQNMRFSGSSVGHTYGSNSDLFILNILESSSAINVNDGVRNDRVRDNTRRLLNALGDIVIGTLTPKLGEAIIDNRPASGYSNKAEILRILQSPGVYGETNGRNYFSNISSFITTHSWQDPDVANPVPLSDLQVVRDKYPVTYNTLYRFGRGKDASGNTIATIAGVGDCSKLLFTDGVAPLPAGNSQLHSIFALDELNPQWIEIVSRSPVNINTADKKVITALLKDLQGFFVADRPAHEPRGGYQQLFTPAGTNNFEANSAYAIGYTASRLYYRPSNSPSTTTPGELGFLYLTPPFAYNPTAAIDSLSEIIAEHILACREKRATTTAPVINYSDAGGLWFRGMFKTWRQFNAFCDNLVSKDTAIQGVLVEQRDIYYWYNWDLTSTSSVCTVDINSNVQFWASQAMADVLKANFNPNLHLNEINPDANLRTLVDKTDLVVNSTEFCFLPTGFFEIESKGLILKPTAPGIANKIAESDLTCMVQIYDQYRETHQSHFLRDYTTGTNVAGQPTNNNKSVEICPEPTSTSTLESYARSNEWEGYIRLPTQEYETTSTMHAHFDESFQAHVHPTNTAAQKDYNYADPGEAVNGPYEYNNDYRICRSFRQGDGQTLTKRAPSDLRSDGAYVERHCQVAYLMNNAAITDPGSASYWVKPYFSPEITGKPRTFFSISTLVKNWGYTGGGFKFSFECTRAFANWFVSQHPSTAEFVALPTLDQDALGRFYSDLPTSWPGFYRPRSLVFGIATVTPTGPMELGPGPGPGPLNFDSSPISFYKSLAQDDPTDGTEGGGFGIRSPTLNHINPGHPNHSHSGTNYLKAGHWVLITVGWNVSSDNTSIYINGASGADPSNPITIHPERADLNGDGQPNEKTYSIASYQIASKIRIGEATRSSLPWRSDVNVNPLVSTPDTINQAADDYWHNWTCDSTVDEFYVRSTQNQDLNMWSRGRYYKPRTTTDAIGKTTESWFTSNRVELKQKDFPMGSTINDPLAGSPPSTPSMQDQITILGVSWTWYPEGSTTSGGLEQPLIRNYKTYTTPAPLNPAIYIRLILNGSILPNQHQLDYFSVTNDLTIRSTDDLRYRVIFDLGLDTKTKVDNTTLLYSPVFDDITFYFKRSARYIYILTSSI